MNLNPGTYVLGILCGSAAAVIAIVLPLRMVRWIRTSIAVVLAVGSTLLVLGVAGATNDARAPGPVFVPGTGVHTIDPPGPSGGVR